MRKCRAKLGARIALVLLMPTIFTGCAKTSTENGTHAESSPESGQTLVYCTWDDERAYTERLVEMFMAEHRDISIEVIYNSEEMTAERAAELLKEEKIDIIGLKDANDVLHLKKYEQVIDITDWILDSGLDVSRYGNMYNDISDKGKYYCLPSRKTCWALAYNKEIFAHEGMDFPEQMTWDEFADLAEQLTTGEGEERQWGCLFGTWVCDFLGIQKKNYLYDDDLTYVQESLELLNRMYFEDCSSMTPDEIEAAGWLESFEQGNVAMMPMGEWLVGMIMEEEKHGKSSVDWDFAPMPVPENQKAGTTWGNYQVVAVTTECASAGRTEAAYEFLSYLCGKDGAKVYAASGMLPAYMDEEIEEIYRDAIGNHNAEVFFDAYLVQESPVYRGYKDLKDILKEETYPLWKGLQSVQETMQNFENRRQQYFENKRS